MMHLSKQQMGNYLVIAAMVLDFGAAIGYTWIHDWRRAIYWAAAGVIAATLL